MLEIQNISNQEAKASFLYTANGSQVRNIKRSYLGSNCPSCSLRNKNYQGEVLVGSIWNLVIWDSNGKCLNCLTKWDFPNLPKVIENQI
jgi:hypothetical protein